MGPRMMDSTHSNNSKAIVARTQAPGHEGEAFSIRSLCGEIIYIPCSKSATRLLVTGKETENAFAIVGTGGAAGDPIGFHFHREAHDVFLCLKGAINVWADDQCRTMGPGDFASVPPGVVHQYQILGDYTEFVGLIVPGGWEEFFRFIGEPYDGPLFPLQDDRNVFEALIPKLKAAAETFDMVPVPNHPRTDPQPWSGLQDDSSLPGAPKPYYLRAGTGPRYLLGGVVCSPLITTAESSDKFAIASVEGTSWQRDNDGPLSLTVKFEHVHHAFMIAEGGVDFVVGDESDQIASLGAGETLYLPRGTAFSIRFRSRYAKFYVFVSGGGLAELMCKAGKLFHQTIPTETPDPWDKSSLERLQTDLGFRYL